MKKCIECGFLFLNDDWCCPNCFSKVDRIDGFLAFSPCFAHDGGGFDPEIFDHLQKTEENNFWFNNRNDLIIWALDSFFPDVRSFFEIGCGTGFVLHGVYQKKPTIKLFGSEIFIQGLQFAEKRLPNVDLLQMDARNIPFENEFDVIGSFDVLEHIKEDELVLQQMYQAIKPGGGIIVTVPQHQFLWSVVDEEALHVRRYSVQDLKQKVEKAGFSIIHTTSFVTLLLPMMFFSRKINGQLKSSQNKCELSLPQYLNNLFFGIMKIESFFIKHKISAPYGGSLLLIAHKK